MYCLKFLILLKKVWNDALKMPSNSLPDADFNLPEMKNQISLMSIRKGSHVCTYEPKRLRWAKNQKPYWNGSETVDF